MRLGTRRLVVLHRDFEEFLKSRSIRPTAAAEAFVNKRLARDGVRRLGATSSVDDT